jgi:hypothetical protein
MKAVVRTLQAVCATSCAVSAFAVPQRGDKPSLMRNRQVDIQSTGAATIDAKQSEIIGTGLMRNRRVDIQSAGAVTIDAKQSEIIGTEVAFSVEVNSGECFIGGWASWGHTNINYGAFSNVNFCENKVRQAGNACNQNMFKWKPSVGCYCFSGLGWTPSACSAFHQTGYKTYEIQAASNPTSFTWPSSNNPGSVWGPSVSEGQSGTCNGCLNYASSRFPHRIRDGIRDYVWYGQFTCSNSFFGYDPVPDVAKTCHCEQNCPQTRRYLAACESPTSDCKLPKIGYCPFGTVKYYGEKGGSSSLRPTTHSGFFVCGHGPDGLFNGDPANNTVKKCECDLDVTSYR